jgi:thiamine biosynthesis protein ThiS
MEIFVNGAKRQIREGLNLTMLLQEFNVDPRSVVVERNEGVVPKTEYEGTSLTEGDKIEIVRFIGGGCGHG